VLHAEHVLTNAPAEQSAKERSIQSTPTLALTAALVQMFAPAEQSIPESNNNSSKQYKARHFRKEIATLF